MDSHVGRIAEPVTEAREMIETYRLYRIMPPRWREVARTAITAINAGGPPESDAVARVAAGLQSVLDVGLDDEGLIDRLSQDAREAMVSLMPENVPSPDHIQQWSFSDPTCA